MTERGFRCGPAAGVVLVAGGMPFGESGAGVADIGLQPGNGFAQREDVPDECPVPVEAVNGEGGFQFF